VGHACLLLAAAIGAPAVHAQTPTPEQVELLKSLPAEQQRALIEQAVQGQPAQAADAPLSTPHTDRPKAAVQAPPASPLIPEAGELKPFGYDVFANVPTTFAPATDIPVPAEYVLGPGDTLEVQLIGERGGRYTLTVGRDGTVDFPNLGPIAVAGMRFPAATDMLEKRVSEQMIGLRASVSMGPLRSIRIFVLGEAERPGSYTVSGLSSITNALFASGGVKPVGSLRNIQLKRNGQIVSHLDLYDLLLDGDTSGDVRLLPGDVIFIPPVGTTVGVAGEVRRPAIYEVNEGARASDLLYLTGGLTPRADPRTARLNRIDNRRNRTILDIDLTTANGRATLLQSGDIIRIQPIRDSLEGSVQLSGNVHRERQEQFRPGMRLTDLVQSLDELKPLTDLHYALIRRETGPDRRVSVLSADLAAAFARPQSSDNVALQARDRVFIFDLATSRQAVVESIMKDLERQSVREEPLKTVGVGGRVKVPGKYPLEAGMTVSDLLRAGGSMDQAAYGGMAELTRYAVIDGERRQTEVIEVDFARMFAGDAVADLALRPFDFLLVKEMPEWRDQETIVVSGEVRFPGEYPVRRGEPLKSVIQRAGGLTALAFPEGSVFTRQELKQREQRQLEVLAERLQRELASLSLQ
jgi:protein involved in polysaccharide export with SLBB domain